MGRQANHHRKWERNRAFLATIPQEHCDWAVTVAFYTALHAAEVLFAFDKIAPHSSHLNRDDTLALSRYETIRTSYKVLKNASRVARYECQPSSAFKAGHVSTILIARHLWTVEQFVQSEVDPQRKPPHFAGPVAWG